MLAEDDLARPLPPRPRGEAIHVTAARQADAPVRRIEQVGDGARPANAAVRPMHADGAPREPRAPLLCRGVPNGHERPVSRRGPRLAQPVGPERSLAVALACLAGAVVPDAHREAVHTATALAERQRMRARLD